MRKAPRSYRDRLKKKDIVRIFFQIPEPLTILKNESLWICFREDLNAEIQRPKILESLFGRVGCISIEKDKAEHFMIEASDYTDIIFAESYSELMKINEDCVTEKFWEEI